MPRTATTTDVFNAIAESKRREIIGVLAGSRAHSVGELVRRLRIPQPAVSKHLGVLRKVGVVSARRHGRLRLYHLNAEELKSVHDWAQAFERYWTHQLDRIKGRAERKAIDQSAEKHRPDPPKEGRP
jgi:DNA-binding transcriptional ArsR family regulator